MSAPANLAHNERRPILLGMKTELSERPRLQSVAAGFTFQFFMEIGTRQSPRAPPCRANAPPGNGRVSNEHGINLEYLLFLGVPDPLALLPTRSSPGSPAF